MTNQDIIWFSDCDHCKGSGLVIGGDEHRQCSKCRLRASDEARKVASAKRAARFMIVEAGRGYGVLNTDSDGEYDYFPTLDEAQSALDRRITEGD